MPDRVLSRLILYEKPTPAPGSSCLRQDSEPSPRRAHDTITKPVTKMERLSKLIRGLRLPGDMITESDLACAAWPQAVGKRIAAHTRAAKLVRRRLVVEVEDQIWQRQLFVLSYHIVCNLERHLGPGVVDDLEFRVVPRRGEPQRAAQSVPSLLDEADSIVDPVLRGLYKA